MRPMLSIFSRNRTAHIIEPYILPDDPPDRMSTDPSEYVSIDIVSPASTETCAFSNRGWFVRIASAYKRFTARIVASLGIFATLTWRKKTPEHDLESGEVVDAQNKDNVCDAIGHTEIAPDTPHGHSPVVPAPYSGTAGVSDVTLVAPSTSLGAARPSRFIERLPDHPVFSSAPANDASIQPSAVEDEPDDPGLSAPLGEQERLKMHEEAAARIKAPALRPFRTRLTVSATVVAPDPHFEPQQAIPADPVNSSKPYTRPKRISMHYEIFKPGMGLGVKEWVEDVRSGRNELTAMGPSALGERRLEVMIPQSPPSSPESSGPVTPTPEFMRTLEMLVDGGKGYDLDDLAPAGRDQYKVGGDGAAAL